MSSALPHSISQLQAALVPGPRQGESTSGQSAPTWPFLASSSLVPLTRVFFLSILREGKTALVVTGSEKGGPQNGFQACSKEQT